MADKKRVLSGDVFDSTFAAIRDHAPDKRMSFARTTEKGTVTLSPVSYPKFWTAEEIEKVAPDGVSFKLSGDLRDSTGKASGTLSGDVALEQVKLYV